MDFIPFSKKDGKLDSRAYILNHYSDDLNKTPYMVNIFEFQLNRMDVIRDKPWNSDFINEFLERLDE